MLEHLENLEASLLASCEEGVGVGMDGFPVGGGVEIHDVEGVSWGDVVFHNAVGVGVGVWKVHVQIDEGVECVQNGAEGDSAVQAGNDHCVKSLHLRHHGIAKQDK